jgi:hypothetical protein
MYNIHLRIIKICYLLMKIIIRIFSYLCQNTDFSYKFLVEKRNAHQTAFQ